MSVMKTNDKMGNICYFQSGGPTPVINATFEGLFEAYVKDGCVGDFYVSPYGVNGLLNNKLKKVEKDSLPSLSVRPGAYFGSARVKLPSDPQDEKAKQILRCLKKNNIRYLFVNGGNDSMDSANTIAQYAVADHWPLCVIGLPKTVDNDLYGCDHTPGFGTAAKFVANAVIAIACDDLSYRQGRVNIVETMGRDSGFIAASSILAKRVGLQPDYIFVPEVPFSIPDFLTKVKATYEKKGHCLVVVSEGIRDQDGVLIASESASKDVFNHQQMGGVCKFLASMVESEGMKTRGIELSLLNRASSFLPSLVDIEEAKESGRQAFLAAKNGVTGVMIAIQREKGEDYKPFYSTVPLQDVSNAVVTLPKKYISKSGDNINPSFISYVLPLIQGTCEATNDEGLLKV